MSENATSTIQINGQRSSPIPIRSSIHQGCPMSMLLFAICLNPLLCTLERNFAGIRIGRSGTKTTTVTNADDVKIFVTKPEEIPIMREALLRYEAALGAKVNIGKQTALAVGSWDTSAQIMNIPYCAEVTILGFHFLSTIRASVDKSWSKLTVRLRAQAQDVYFRDLSLHSRMKYIHEYLLAKAWYTAQIFPPPDGTVRQVNTTISWYLWKGDIFSPSIHPTKVEGRGRL